MRETYKATQMYASNACYYWEYVDKNYKTDKIKWLPGIHAKHDSANMNPEMNEVITCSLQQEKKINKQNQ